jgi:hypothetical protein
MQIRQIENAQMEWELMNTWTEVKLPTASTVLHWFTGWNLFKYTSYFPYSHVSWDRILHQAFISRGKVWVRGLKFRNKVLQEHLLLLLRLSTPESPLVKYADLHQQNHSQEWEKACNDTPSWKPAHKPPLSVWASILQIGCNLLCYLTRWT